MPEQRLLARYVEERDAEAFRELVTLHQNLVYATCRRILNNTADAEDAAQECFLALARKPEQVKGCVGGWLHRAAIGVSINMVRQDRSRKAREAKAMGERTVAADSASWEEISGAIDRAVNELPDDLRIPIIRYYLEGQKQEDIAGELNMTDSAVSKRLQRGVDILRAALRKGGWVGSAALLASLLSARAVEAAPTTLVAALGKMAMAGMGGGSTTAAAAAHTGGFAMKAALATLAGAIVVTGGLAVYSALAQKQPPSVNPGPTAAAQEPAAAPGKTPREPLPYDLATVAGMDSLKDAGDAARGLLARNGFVVMPQFCHQIFSPYIHGGLPPFVTMDSLHRTFHVILEEQVKRMETALAPEVAKISLEMRATASRINQPDGAFAADYFSVGSTLLGEKPPEAAGGSRVAAEVRLIEAAAGRAQSPLFGYEVDYSQFKPRGFYNDSPALQRYYRAMTWYGDMAFRQCSPEETRTAMLIASLFKPVRKSWGRIDGLYSHFIGPSDDLTPAEYADALARAAEPNAFAAEVARLRDPKYNSMVLAPEKMPEWRKWTKGMRFFGKRYLPDGEIFMALAYAVPGKLLPSGLDVAAANGSARAREILQAQGALNSPENRKGLEAVTRTLTELKASPAATHYVEFLRLTESLWLPPPEGAPEFMKTAAYTDKNLTTALAAWASMRHTWQLQGKQSVMYAGMTRTPPAGYVEPNLEFMRRLDALVARTCDILKNVAGADIKRLEEFRSLVGDVRALAQKQLEGRPLTGKDEQLFQNYGPRIAQLMYFEGNAYLNDKALPWMSLISDVHTEHLTSETLEVGTGGAMPIYVTVPAQGKRWLMVGGVYSYYEFAQPIADRLTDEAWRNRWTMGNIPPAPPWTASYVAGKDIGPLIEKLKRGEIADELRYVSDPRIEEALKKELAPGGAFAEGEKREAALGLLAARIGREAMPLLKEAAFKGPLTRPSPVLAALAMLSEPKDLEEFKTRALTSTGPDAAACAEVLAARRDADAYRALMDVFSGAASREARDVAMQCIAAFGGRAVTPVLLKTWQTAPDRRYFVLISLARLWAQRPERYGSVQPLMPAPTPAEEAQYRAQVTALASEALKSDVRDLRREACGLAGALGAAELLPALEQMALGADGDNAVWARLAIEEMDSPLAAPILVRMLKRPNADIQMLVTQLTYKRKCMEAWPALVELLDDHRGAGPGRQACDYAAEGLARLDPDGPGYYYFRETAHVREDMDRLVQCWKAYAEAKKNKGLAALDPAARAKYAEDLLALTDSAQSSSWRWNARDVSFKWSMQARQLAENLPAGDQHAALSARCQDRLVKLTQDEVLWIKDLFEKYYKRDFGDYPPETPGNWENAFTERHTATIDPARRNAAGQLCDPWGNPYRYLRAARHSTEPFEIYSFGPNGKDDDGKGDDIVSWK